MSSASARLGDASGCPEHVTVGNIFYIRSKVHTEKMETKIKVTDSCGGSTGSEIHPGSGSSLSTLLLPLGLSGLEKVPAGQSFCDGSLLRSATLTSVSLHNLLLL